MSMPDPFSSASETSKRLPVRAGLIKRIGIVLLLLFLAAGLMVFLRPSPPSVIIGPLPEGWPARKHSLADRVMGAMPIWLWRVKDSFSGPAKHVLLRFAVMDCQALSDSPVSALALDKPDFTA